jgi:transcriptional regulator with XRE-family HTH domain
MACLAAMAIQSRKKLAQALGKRIRTLRIKKGLSLKHFEAKEDAIDRHALSDIEHGKKVPNLYTLLRIATVLDVPLEEFVKKLK